jgi:hypothetical protein
MIIHALDAAADSARTLRDTERAAAQTSDAPRPLRPFEPFVPTEWDLKYDSQLDAAMDGR